MKQMHRNDNEENDGQRPNRAERGDAASDPSIGSGRQQFTITCDRCGGGTAVDEYDDDLQCAHCGARIGTQSDAVVSFRPGMTPQVRWVGRIVLAALGLMGILAIWAVLANRAR